MAKLKLLELNPTGIREAFDKRYWQSGRLPNALLLSGQASDLFPLQVDCRAPTAAEWLQNLPELDSAHRQLQAHAEQSQIKLIWEQQSTRHSGTQRYPKQILLETPAQAIRYLRRQSEVRHLQTIAELIQQHFPSPTFTTLWDWIQASPLRLLSSSAEKWVLLLGVAAYLRQHPRPNCYLRDLNLAGLDSKFIEQNKRRLADLLDRVLPESAITSEIPLQANHGFARRYGFCWHSPQIRFRFLDPANQVGPFMDLSVPLDDLAQWNPPVSRVIICENLMPFLRFPALADTLLIFGQGQAVHQLLKWLDLLHKQLWYWGDLDPEGLAILAGFRQLLPAQTSLRSILMDLSTFQLNRQHWVQASGYRPAADTAWQNDEQELIKQLLAPELPWRLEQERISQSSLLACLKAEGFQVLS